MDRQIAEPESLWSQIAWRTARIVGEIGCASAAIYETVQQHPNIVVGGGAAFLLSVSIIDRGERDTASLRELVRDQRFLNSLVPPRV